MGWAVVLTVFAAAGGALAQDAPPPGCRWQGETLACKDGKGYWRRSGDGEIVGTYPLAKPKPKPKPVAAVGAGAAATASIPQTQAAPTSAELLPPPPPPPPPPAKMLEPAAPQPEIAVAAQSAPATPAAAPPAPEARKSWWRRWLDDIVSDLRSLLKLFGIGR
jgi:hypothetical protein